MRGSYRLRSRVPCYRAGQETFAGTRVNERDAPIPALCQHHRIAALRLDPVATGQQTLKPPISIHIYVTVLGGFVGYSAPQRN